MPSRSRSMTRKEGKKIRVHAARSHREETPSFSLESDLAQEKKELKEMKERFQKILELHSKDDVERVKVELSVEQG